MIEERHEIVKFSPKIPIKIFMHKIGFVTRHWHKSIELLMILEGTVNIKVDDRQYTLTHEDIIVINSNSIHEIRSEGAVMIALQIDLARFDNLGDDLENMIFDCNSAGCAGDDAADRNNTGQANDDAADQNNTGQANDDAAGRISDGRAGDDAFGSIRYAIATMIRENAHNARGTDYKNYAISYYLISELMANFQAKASTASQNQKKYMARLTRMVSYIQEHYAENFTLSDLAAAENLSVPYLSNFFDKYMGVKFSQYYTSVKLEHAVTDLQNTDDSIEEIAVRNGFTESHAFVRAFKKTYGMLPSTWRKEKQNGGGPDTPASNLNYLQIEPSNYLHLLTKYLPKKSGFITTAPVEHLDSLTIDAIDVQSPIKNLKHSFKTFTTVGRAKELLNREIQQMLTDLQKNIGFTYIKFHGILSDDMMVVSRTADQKLHFHYTLVDMALDFLMSIGLKPMIQYSFMPRELASDRRKQIFYSAVNTSPPKSMDEWNMLIEDFTKHLMDRYGESEVCSWLFTVWNEPVTPTTMFGFENNADFYQLYKNTFDTVKRVHAGLCFGSPSLLYMENLGNDKWIRNFLSWTHKNRCFPEFINLHYYSDILPDTSHSIGLAPVSTFPRRTDDFSLWIGGIRKILSQCGADHLPVYLTEWNFTLSHRNLINDTCFKSCYIMKNLLRNYDRLDSFGYWSLTDLLEENALPDTLFHGGLGMYTMNGLRKNVFYAYFFANMLGDELLANGDGYFITRKKDSYQIITYNYVHYGDLFAAGELYDITETRRYSAFDMSRKLQPEITLTGIEQGTYEVREYFVNRQYGSAYDIWVKMGGVPLDPRDTELFRGMCVPGYHKELRLVENEQMTYLPVLEPLEIRFAEIARRR